jgi:hypothetical protein
LPAHASRQEATNLAQMQSGRLVTGCVAGGTSGAASRAHSLR